MKKIFRLMLAFLLVFTLTSCSKDDKTDKLPDDDNKEETETKTEEEQILKPDATIVTFCSWDIGTKEDNNMMRRLINEYNAVHDDIQIKIIVPDGDYDTFLTTMASGRKLPDLFMTNSVPTAVINSLAGDITEIANADQEWLTIEEALRNSVTYEGHIYGIPTAQHYLGFYANYQLIGDYIKGSQSANQVFAPGNFTHEQFIETVKNIHEINVSDGTGKIGVNATGDMINWLPAVLDESGKTGHFVWNAETKSFGYRSEQMYSSLNIIKELCDKNALYTFESVVNKDSEKASEIFGTTSAFDAFRNGQVGFIQSGTWETFEESDVLDYKFVAYPDKTVVSASDYMCVSRSSKHKKAAFEIAKYLSFGVDGTKKRFEIIDNDPDSGLAMLGLPIVNNKEISDKWFSYVKLNGVKEVYDLVMEGKIKVLVEGNKTVPGFQDARFKALTGLSYPDVRGGAVLNMSDFIWDVCSGAISVDTYMTDMSANLEAQMNKYVSDSYANIIKVIERDSK